MKPPEPKYENRKHANLRPQYVEGMREIAELGLRPAEYIEHFPAFAGHLSLARYLSLYEAYKMTLEVAGHIAEVGVSMGAGSLLFGKLTKLFEPNSVTLVHGFDWFKGAVVTPEERYVKNGECQVDEALVRRLIRVQGLENIVHLHNLDVTTQLAAFFAENSHLMFKLVFLDIGLHAVVSEKASGSFGRESLRVELNPDHYSHEFAPGEARAIRELLPDVAFKQFQFGWMPVAYAIKK